MFNTTSARVRRLRTRRRATARRNIRTHLRRHALLSQATAAIVITTAFLGINIAAVRTEAASGTIPEPPHSTPADPTNPAQPPRAEPAPQPTLPDGYEYLNTVSGSPVLANACAPVILNFDASNTPPDGGSIVARAIERATTMTGLNLVTSGTNTSSTRIEISFRSETEDPNLAGTAIGVARTRSTTGETGARISTAIIHLETEWFTTAIPANPDLTTMVVLHEIGHALGLDHVSDPASIMYPSANASIPSVADNQAFAALNAGCAIAALDNDSIANNEIITTIPITATTGPLTAPT